MATQPEQILENDLIKQLVELGFAYVDVKDEKDILDNRAAKSI